MEKEQKDLFLVIYNVYFNDGKVQYLQPTKYKVFHNSKDANDFVVRYNKLMKPQNREILHAEIHLANQFVGWDNIKQYREDMDWKEEVKETKNNETNEKKRTLEDKQADFRNKAFLLTNQWYRKTKQNKNVDRERLDKLETTLLNYVGRLKGALDKQIGYSEEYAKQRHEYFKNDLRYWNLENYGIRELPCSELLDKIYCLWKEIVTEDKDNA